MLKKKTAKDLWFCFQFLMNIFFILFFVFFSKLHSKLINFCYENILLNMILFQKNLSAAVYLEEFQVFKSWNSTFIFKMFFMNVREKMVITVIYLITSYKNVCVFVKLEHFIRIFQNFYKNYYIDFC